YDPTRIRQPRMEVPRVGDRIFTLPPTQHPKPNAGPNAGPDEIASEQMADRVEPCDELLKGNSNDFTGSSHIANCFDVESELLQKAAFKCSFLALVLEKRVLLHARRAANHSTVTLDSGRVRRRVMAACSKIARPPASRIAYCFMMERHSFA